MSCTLVYLVSIALHWTLSSLSTSLLIWESKNWIQYSVWPHRWWVQDITTSLSLLSLQLLMSPGMHFALFTMSAHCLLSFSLASTVIPRVFSVSLLFSQSVPILSWCVGLFSPRGRAMDSLLKFLMVASSSRLWRSAWRADSLFVLWPLCWFSIVIKFANGTLFHQVLDVYSTL